MLIHLKMPTIVGILTFISMIKTTSESLKVRNFKSFIFQHFKQLKFHAQLSMNKFYNLRAWSQTTQTETK